MTWITWGRDYSIASQAIPKQRDRGAAIIAQAILEQHLTVAINLRFSRPKTGAEKRLFADIESKMFKGIGPFASFSNKIDFGFLLGLYPPYAHRQLHRIKEIRNLFAHNPQPISFRSQKVRDICAHLKAPKGAHRRFSGMFDSILSDHNAPRVRLSFSGQATIRGLSTSARLNSLRGTSRS